ncbi:OmpA family protein [uncultured Psychrobacter sp.]|uniref:OmpA family protein n=1 Tax=uncultured Psychrobacter sp. TaxID=259303 RepID=UPI003457DD73
MKTKSGMTIAIAVSVLMLAGCQHTLVTPSKINSTPQNIDNDIKIIVPLPDIPDSDGDGVLDHVDYCPKTPANIVVDNEGCPVSVNLIGLLVMELRVFFDMDSDEVKDKYLPEIEKVAEKLRYYPEQVVVLTAHTSEIENAQAAKFFAENKAHKNSTSLGRRRAQTIKNALIKRNIAADRIYTFDCASALPIAPSDTEEGRAFNQRIYGISMPANDFYMGEGHGYRDSYAYYKRMCEQF